MGCVQALNLLSVICIGYQRTDGSDWAVLGCVGLCWVVLGSVVAVSFLLGVVAPWRADRAARFSLSGTFPFFDRFCDSGATGKSAAASSRRFGDLQYNHNKNAEFRAFAREITSIPEMSCAETRKAPPGRGFPLSVPCPGLFGSEYEQCTHRAEIRIFVSWVIFRTKI